MEEILRENFGFGEILRENFGPSLATRGSVAKRPIIISGSSLKILVGRDFKGLVVSILWLLQEIYKR
ncbi:hypothetical protein PIB30_014726 [Stylosanthes scabra]|uniref:Uncharacterized protein n=1 Tax=Stylosanthes scabra TaxID=79078 RepID=A0ABU6W6G7_9FABA|nr:hypothetical protein [Stylosanthes scabra]